MIIYLVREKSTNNFRIEYADSIREARSTAQSMDVHGIRRLSLMQVWQGTRSQKEALHRHFREYAIGQGWFCIPPTVVVDLIETGFDDVLALFGEPAIALFHDKADRWLRALKRLLKENGHDPHTTRTLIPSSALRRAFVYRGGSLDASYREMWSDLRDAMDHPDLAHVKRKRTASQRGLEWTGRGVPRWEGRVDF